MGSSCTKANPQPVVVRRVNTSTNAGSQSNFGQEEQQSQEQPIVSKYSAQTIPNQATSPRNHLDSPRNNANNGSTTNYNKPSNPVSTSQNKYQTGGQTTNQGQEATGLQGAQIDENDEAAFMSGLSKKKEVKGDSKDKNKNKDKDDGVIAIDFASHRGGFGSKGPETKEEEQHTPKALKRNESHMRDKNIKDIINNPDEAELEFNSPGPSADYAGKLRNTIKEKDEEGEFDVMDFGHERNGSTGYGAYKRDVNQVQNHNVNQQPTFFQHQQQQQHQQQDNNFGVMDSHKSYKKEEDDKISEKSKDDDRHKKDDSDDDKHRNHHHQVLVDKKHKEDSDDDKKKPDNKHIVKNDFEDLDDNDEQDYKVKIDKHHKPRYGHDEEEETDHKAPQQVQKQQDSFDKEEFEYESPARTKDTKQSPKKVNNKAGAIDEEEIEPFEEDFDYN